MHRTIAQITHKKREDDCLILTVRVSNNFIIEDDSIILESGTNVATHRQLNFAYAMFSDIADYIGESKGNVKEIFKGRLGINTMSEVTRDELSKLIEVLIEFCKENEIPLRAKTVHQMDADKRVNFCKYYKVCLLCGTEFLGEHHIDVIGMGRDRQKVDKMYPELKKVPLCIEHHSEIETIGSSKFIEKYHLEDYKQYFERVGSVR